MAETRSKSPTAKKVVENNDTIDEINLSEADLEKSVVIHNIAGWNVTFSLRNREGDVVITRNSKQRLPRNEIQAQIYNGNNLFSGTDGKGSHATIYIEDATTRRWLGFETSNENQKVFTDDIAKKLFNMTQDEFEKELSNYIVTRAEKYALNEAIKRLNFNDYRKIVYVSKYTGFPLI